MSKKVLRKNHFRYNTDPRVIKTKGSNKGKGHVSWSSAKKGKKEKVNVITHADTFLGLPTKLLLDKPEKSSKNIKKSRASAPIWVNQNNLQPAKGTWRMSHRDARRLRAANKKYAKTGKWQ